jgi:hypothetical protein
MGLDGGPNLNHRLMPSVMEYFVADGVTSIRQRPAAYLRTVARASIIYWAPPTEHPAYRAMRKRLPSWDQWYTRLYYGVLGSSWPAEHRFASRLRPYRDLVARVSWLHVVLAAWCIPARWCARGTRGGPPRTPPSS